MVRWPPHLQPAGLTMLFERETISAIPLRMTSSPLHAAEGGRKYLNGAERKRYLAALDARATEISLFCRFLALSGARISEALAVTPAALDLDRRLVSLITLKRRRPVTREVPLPAELIAALDAFFGLTTCQLGTNAVSPLWEFSRTTAWRHVHESLAACGLVGARAMPKALRHGFAVAAFQAGVPPHLVQKWMGHASMRTTAIYGDVSGPDERMFAEKMWN